jgi:aspartate aminotransferase
MIPAELGSLLRPLERFEEIRRRVARLGDRLCDLSYANPYEGVHQAARQALRDSLDDERQLDLQYSPFGGQTLARRAAADALRESHGLPFAAQDVILTPGAMAALQISLRAAGSPGDEVLIPVPCWLDYPLYVRHAGLEPRLVPLSAENFELDVDAVAAALSERTCAVLLGHPGNPTGRNHHPDALALLAEVLRHGERHHGREITLIADETHRDFVAEGEYTSAAGPYERTVIVYSFGKYHFMQGQRLGYAATSPRHPDRERTRAELVAWTRIAGFATPTALMQRALPRLLTLRHDHGWLERWRSMVVDRLRSAGFGVTEPDATMFVYVRTPDGHPDDFAFLEEMATRGVLVLPAPVFHHGGHFRISLTGTEESLERGLAILEEAAA